MAPLTAAAAHAARVCGDNHLVEFYETDAFLVDTLVAFVGPALRDGDAAIVVASPAHRQKVETALAQAGIDIDAAVRDGRYRAVDAAATLQRFMVDGELDATRFHSAMTPMIDGAQEGGRRVRVYGEMVALLWAEGDVTSALALEDLWNELVRLHTFSLLCAYPLRLFADTATGTAFRRVCEQHTTVIPTEAYTLLADPDARARAVAELQQQAASLGAELAQRDLDDSFRLMVHGVEDYAIFMLNAQGQVASWNAGAQRCKGYRPEDIIGRHFSVFYPPEDVAAGKPERALMAAAANGHLEDEGWRVRQNGEQFWANVVITALRDPDGTLRGYGKITRDLSERRAAQLELRASEERFRCSFDEARIGMMIIGLDGRYERVNDAFCAIVGYSQEQLAGTQRATITHPDDVAADAAAVRALLAGDATAHVSEKRYLHASGHPVWVEINLALVRDAEGRPLRLIAQVQDITERRRHEHQLRHMADHDPLTGRLNRRSFERELQSHAARGQRYGATGAVLMLDLDHFKYFNDTFGHSAGDRLIVRIAHDLQSRLRSTDVLARLGGDEFAILLPGEDERTALAVAESLLQVVRDQAMPALIGRQRRVTASIGVACFDDGEHLTPEDMMINADLAMYDAKEAGRDRSARYRSGHRDRPRIESRMKWAEQINDAIANDGFELHAQPIVPLGGDAPAQYELLLRMRDRDGALVAPGLFLYVAEQLGLIRQIDHWVTRRAIDMLAEQRVQGRDLRLEVNLSGLTIGDEGLLELVARRLRATGVPPDRLIFEVTETAAVTHIGRAARFAGRLSELGCGFALDDFGAGFGSFYYLKHLPFDYLKIDGEFVRQCVENQTDRILISAVVQIARGMGKLTIAEYVTSQDTVDVLAGLGVDYGQGFHLGRPAPLTDHLAGSRVDASAS